jgi:hypothetical protein
MEWLCVVSGLDSREDLGNAYTTIRDLVIDQPDPVRRVSIKRLTVSRSEEKRTHSICIHSLAVPPGHGSTCPSWSRCSSPTTMSTSGRWARRFLKALSPAFATGCRSVPGG